MNDVSPLPRRGRALGHGALAGLAAAVLGSALLACAETAAVVFLSRRFLVAGAWPWDLIAAALGKRAVTYLLLTAPPLFVAGLVAGWRGWRLAPLLTGLFLAFVSLVLLPAHLHLLHLPVAAIVALIGCALVASLVVAWACGRWERRLAPFQRPLAVATGVASVVVLVFAVVFWRSPLFDPASYALPEGEPAEHSPRRPHVLWLDLDTVRADRMSVHGYGRDTTPFLREWTRDAVVFDRATSDGIWTVPSHASMFTGMSVRQHGVDWGHLWLDRRFTTLADRLSERGYATMLLSNNPWLTRSTNLVQGFAEVQNVYELKKIAQTPLEHLGELLGIVPPLPWLDPDFGAALTNHWAGRWLDARAGRPEPLFLFVHYMDAHLPYRIPRAYRERFLEEDEVKRSYALRRQVHGEIVNVLDVDYNTRGGDFLSAADTEILRRQYEATIRYLDDRVRELLGSFAARGLLADTLVVVTSDHGEYLADHGMWAHRFHVYDDVSHVTMIVRQPDRSTARVHGRVTTPVQLSDLYATVLEAVQVPYDAPPGPTARDLLALAIAGEEERVAIVQGSGAGPQTQSLLLENPDPEIQRRAIPRWAVVDGQFKFIEGGDGLEELYDLRSDPEELHDLLAADPETAGRLRQALATWRQTVPKYERPKDARPAPELDPETLEALRSLGYVDAGN